MTASILAFLMLSLALLVTPVSAHTGAHESAKVIVAGASNAAVARDMTGPSSFVGDTGMHHDETCHEVGSCYVAAVTHAYLRNFSASTIHLFVPPLVLSHSLSATPPTPPPD